jgi:hypothetical protein
MNFNGKMLGFNPTIPPIIDKNSPYAELGIMLSGVSAMVRR